MNHLLHEIFPLASLEAFPRASAPTRFDADVLPLVFLGSVPGDVSFATVSSRVKLKPSSSPYQ